MKAICLVKQVPALGAIEFDEETHSLKREGVPVELNAFDEYAVQHAVQLADEVVAMTMGPPQAEEALRDCLALGAQRAIHLSDRVFAVADTLGTSRTLALAIEKEGADLVLCGRKALDSETWQVPCQVAAFLGWPHVTSAAAVERSGDSLRITRHTDFGEEVYEVELPVVVSVGASTGAGAERRSERPDRRLAGDRSGRRPPAGRQALRPDRVADTRARRPRRSARACRDPSRERRRGGGQGAGAARRARPRATELGEAGPHRG